jgi:hypothetical protein
VKRCLNVLFSLFLIWGGYVFAGGDPTLEMLGCIDSICEKVARKVDYQYMEPEESFTLKMDHFSIEIPHKRIEKFVTSNEDVIILFEDKQLLAISESSGPPIEGLQPELVSQFPEIVFNKRPDDPVPDGDVEADFWKIAIASKQFYFQDANEVSYTKSGDLTYYISDTNQLGFSARAMVASSKYKQVSLMVEAKQMSFKEFEKVIYSAK